MLNNFHSIAFTHRNLDVSDIGKLHIEEAKQQERLLALKEELHLDELMFLSTCNRVEFLFCTTETTNFDFLVQFFHTLYPDFASETAKLTKGQIMQQAATAMLAQANQMPNVILSLLK